MGLGCSYHPYECSHDRWCEHCTLAETKYHDPSNCALCDFFETGEPRKMVDEPFGGYKIRVWDVSHRYQKINVKSTTQQVLL